MNPSVTPNVLDIGGLAGLRRQARANDPQGIRAAAQQFEALFLQQMLKAMREATPQDGLFDSDQTRLYQSLLDQQLAQVMSGRSGGMGLARLIEQQMSRTATPTQVVPNGAVPQPTQSPAPLRGADAGTVPGANAAPGGEFLRNIWPHAEAAGQALGVPGRFIAAQAALESGWGRSVPHFADGRSSYNLFGIKAGSGWKGPVVEATTSEFADGRLQRRVEKFRAYGSYEEAFRDYTALIGGDPRYAAVRGSGSASQFAQGLQRAGYATDPHYADKLERLILGSALQVPRLA